MNPTIPGGRGRDPEAAASAGAWRSRRRRRSSSRTATFRAALFGEHPYARTSETEAVAQGDGSREAGGVPPRSLPPEQRVSAGRRRDRSRRDVRRGAKRRSAAWARGEVPQPAFPAPPALTGRHLYFVQRPNSIQSSIAVGNIAVKRSDPRWFELTLANTIYGGAFNSRIVRNIREEKGYTYSPQSVADRLRRRRLLPVRGRRAQRGDRRDADRGVQGDRQACAPKAATAPSCRARSRTCAASSRSRPRRRPASSATLNNVYVFGLPKDYPETFRAKIAAVTPEQVKSAAPTLLGSENSVDRDRRRLREGEGSARRRTRTSRSSTSNGKKSRAAVARRESTSTSSSRAGGRGDVRRGRRHPRRSAGASALVAVGVSAASRAATGRCERPRPPRAAAHQRLAAVHADVGVRDRRVALPARLTLVASGDFDGRGVWTFEQDGAFVDATYDWRLSAEKPLLRNLSFLLKPIFEANHRWAMAQGEESLKLELARRRATSDAARARGAAAARAGHLRGRCDRRRRGRRSARVWRI